MRNVFIILGLASLLGIAGFVSTAEILRRKQNADAAVSAPVRTGNRFQDVVESNRRMSQAVGGLSTRQDYAAIAGGIGAGVGFLLGLVMAYRLDSKKRQTDTPRR